MFLGLGILVYCVRPVIRFGAIKVDKNTSTFLELIRINTASTLLVCRKREHYRDFSGLDEMLLTP
jgi:hypothetical protein